LTTQNIAGATNNENNEMNGGLCPPNPRSCGEPVQHGHRVHPEPPAGKHIRRSPQTNLRQTINTSTQLPTSQTMQHSRRALKEQLALVSTKWLKAAASTISIAEAVSIGISHIASVPAMIAACAMSTEWLKATAGNQQNI
jgi:uncharacterized membrane protein